MNILPVALSWADSGPLPDGYLAALELLVLNATLVLNRTVGVVAGVDTTIEVRSTEITPADLPRSGVPPQGAWDAAVRSLKAAGLDPTLRPLFVTLASGGAGGLGLRYGAPSGGALAVIGGGAITAGLLPIPPPPWTTVQRDFYAQVVWLAVHELGHALGGLPHNPPTDPSALAQGRLSFMNYNSLWYWRGAHDPGGTTYTYMSTVGWTADELAALRASPHVTPAVEEYVRLYPFDREVVGRMKPDAPAWQVLTTGFFLQEYPGFLGGQYR